MRNHSALLDHPVGFAARDGRYYDPMSALAAATVASSLISSDSSRSSANTQSDAANHSAELQQQQFQQTRDSLQPFINTGYEAQGSLRNLLGLGTPTDTGTYGSLSRPFDAAAFDQYKDPGYQFQLQQGLQGLQNSQAAQNGALSGAALKDLIGFNQGMANTAYQNAYTRFADQRDSTYKRLADLLGVGENAAAGVGNMGVQTSSNIGNTLTSGAAARAAGQIGSANAFTGGINNGMGYYMLNNMTGGNLFGGGGGISNADVAASHAAGMDLINSQLAGL